MAMNGNEGGSAYPPNPDVKSGSCLIAGFQPLTVVHPIYWNAYKTESGATFSQTRQLATLYWFTVEYGVVLQDGRPRAYGAGLLSSFGELGQALDGTVEIRPFDPAAARDAPYPITTYQPLLWSVGSIREGFASIAAWWRDEGLST